MIKGKSKIKEGILYGGSLTWNPEFVISESEGSENKKLSLGGIALVEGLSKNNNRYKIENLVENNGNEFKWLVGHPKTADPDFVVGKGELAMEGEILKHSGWIMNTAKYPDLIEKVKEGLLGPSIHASFKKLEPVKTEEGLEYHVSGLNIEGIGLVSFQGVKSASIDYAIQEAYESASSLEDKADLNVKMEESNDSEVDHGGDKMEEKLKQLEEQNALLQKELENMKIKQKESIVEEVCKLNDSLVKEDLMKESEEILKLRMDYESRLIKESEEVSKEESTEESEKEEEKGESESVETKKEDSEEVKEEAKDSYVLEKDGSVTLSEKGYLEFKKYFESNF